MSLDRYRSKRDFRRTPEPDGGSGSPGRDPQASGSTVVGAGSSLPGGRFVVQRHRARQLHYDFRLEIDGVLVSWAVPKGPTLDPGARRAAFHVEDHPLDYFDFEGTIPKGEYGGGDVIVWDWGTFEAEGTQDPGAAIGSGELKFRLAGRKLRGRFTIVRTKGWNGDGGRGRDSWLLIKKKDEAASSGWDAEDLPKSVKTGRTNDEVAAGRPAQARPADPFEAGSPAPMPSFVEPMAATLADGPFSDPDWLFELKWDGYRVQAHVRHGRVNLYTRRGQNAASYFPELAGPADWIGADEAIVDGEVVALDENGEPDFSLLQASRASAARRPSRRRGDAAGVEGVDGSAAASAAAPGRAALVYEAFDLLYLDGRSLLDEPLTIRKRLLRGVLTDSSRVRYVSHVEEDGETFYEAVVARGLEGVIAKLARSRYEPGRRSSAWLKLKRRAEQEFAIGGWTTREGADDLAALLLGVFEDGALRPVGKAGTGFGARERRQLIAALTPLGRATSPFRPIPREPYARWVEPKLVARVEFAEWTADGNLRAASYKGLDPLADAGAVVRERAHRVVEARREAEADSVRAAEPGSPVPALRGTAAGRRRPSRADPGPSSAGATGASSAELEALDALPARGGLWSVGDNQLKLSNLDKPIWPGDGLMKRDLIRFYVTIAPYLLPYLRRRALTLHRYPDGIERSGFWQKQVPKHGPEWIERWSFRAKAAEATDYLVAESAAALAWIANEAAIDIHPSTYVVEAPDRPTWALIDIDPGRRTTWDEVLVLARLYRTALDHLGVRGFPKLSGQRGIQVWIPIEPAYSFEGTRDWVMAVSRSVAATVPELISWEWAKDRREGLARLDFTQNAWNKTLVAPYSVRPVPGAPVSAPITWDELDDPELSPECWTIQTIASRLEERGDLMADALVSPQRLPRL
jgi:bifunctional non-homologous end joining protein LigD